MCILISTKDEFNWLLKIQGLEKHFVHANMASNHTVLGSQEPQPYKNERPWSSRVVPFHKHKDKTTRCITRKSHQIPPPLWYWLDIQLSSSWWMKHLKLGFCPSWSGDCQTTQSPAWIPTKFSTTKPYFLEVS